MEIGSSAGLATSLNQGLVRSQQALQGIQGSAEQQQRFASFLSQSVGQGGGASGGTGAELQSPDQLGTFPGNNANAGVVTGERGTLLNIVV